MTDPIPSRGDVLRLCGELLTLAQQRACMPTLQSAMDLSETNVITATKALSEAEKDDNTAYNNWVTALRARADARLALQSVNRWLRVFEQMGEEARTLSTASIGDVPASLARLREKAQKVSNVFNTWCPLSQPPAPTNNPLTQLLVALLAVEEETHAPLIAAKIERHT